MFFEETSCPTFNDYVKTDNLSSCLKLLYTNIRSIRQTQKFEDLKCRLDISSKFDIIVIVASWLKEEEQDYFQLKDYDLVTLNRKDRVGGGIMVYVHASWQSNLTTSLNTVNAKHQFLTLHLSHQNLSLNYHLTVVYNPSVSNISTFLLDFSNYLSSLIQTPKDERILIGDFNINLNSDSQQAIEYLSILDSFGYTLANHKFPTRISDTSSTLLDHIFLSSTINQAHISNISDDLSDHNVLALIYFNLLCQNY